MSLEPPLPGTELPRLTHATKPNYRGFAARATGVLVWIISKIPLRVAREWFAAYSTNYHTTIGTTVYSPEGLNIGLGLWLHEGVHAWQEQTAGTLSYRFNYIFRPYAGRLELEAQAYAAEIAANFRTIESAVEALAEGIYFPEPWANVGEATAFEAVTRHTRVWEKARHDRSSLKALAYSARPIEEDEK